MGRPSKPTPDKACEKCGKKLERKRINGRLEDLSVFNRRHYCDRACMAAAQEGVIKVPNAKNGRRQAAKTVRPACDRCGKNTSRLSVHHKDENTLNNDPGNLESLCGSCHKKEHLSRSSSRRGKKPAPAAKE
jgi:hypothetical protein